MRDIDQIVTNLNRISLLAQLRDKVSIAFEAGRSRCGSCYFWMKSRECPREQNVQGMSRGPSANAPPCGKFQPTTGARELMQRRLQEAIDFADLHDLPVPHELRVLQ